MANVSEVTTMSPNTEFSDTVAANSALGSTAIAADDAVDISVQPSEVLPLISKFRTLPTDGLLQELKNYLRKPQSIASGNFASTDTPSTFGDFNTSVGLYSTMLSAKLSGVLSVSYTAVLTMQINANRFQQGLYILAFVPTGGMYDDAQATAWRNMHRFSEVQVTTLPHVTADINCDTSVQLRIPFKSAFPAVPYRTGTNWGDPGRAFIYPYIALSSASGSTTAGYTIWLHYEDVVLGGHTVPQSGGDSRGFNIARNVDITQAEQLMDGPISGTLTKVAQAAGILSYIPLLSSVASPVAWFSAALAKSAATFGWSKPILANPPMRVVRQPFPFLCNSDAHDGTNSLAVSSNNHVEVMPSFAGSDVDEMSLQYITSIPAFYEFIGMDVIDPKGKKIATYGLSPSFFGVPSTDGVTLVQSYTPLAWVSKFFNWYSGGIIFKIKFAKTEFHSGRLLFTFTPYESTLTGNPDTFATNNYIHKQILDIREANEFVIEVPFVSITPWRPTAGNGYIYGSANIYILDPLVAPATVSSIIYAAVEVCGSKDLIFASPKPFKEGYVIPFSLQSGATQDETRPCMSTISTIGGTTPNDVDLSKASCCVGEVIPNFRVMLKRGGFLNQNGVVDIASGARAQVVPRAWAAFTNSAAAAPTVNQRCNDIFSHMSAVYALNRGGVRLKIVPTMTHTQTNYMSSLNMRDSNSANIANPVTTSSPGFFNNYWRGANSNWNISQVLVGGPDVQAPMYNWLHAFPCGANMTATALPLVAEMRSAADHSVVNFMPCNTEDTFVFNYFNVYRSGADDCNFGLFTSIPPMWDPGDPE